jgi:hypothetical protein
MVQDATTELAGLRVAVERLTQGLRLMLETQATQTEMLRAVLEAATQPPPEGGQLEIALDSILTQLRDQSGRLERIVEATQTLPAEIGAAVAASVRDGLAGV